MTDTLALKWDLFNLWLNLHWEEFYDIIQGKSLVNCYLFMLLNSKRFFILFFKYIF